MKIRKLITIFSLAVFILQSNPVNPTNLKLYKQTTNSIAIPSFVNQNPEIIRLYNAFLMKITDAHYLYIDKKNNNIEIIQDEKKVWKARFNGRNCKFNARFFNQFGMRSSLEEERDFGRKFVGLLKKGFEVIEERDGVALRAPGVIGGMQVGDETDDNKLFEECTQKKCDLETVKSLIKNGANVNALVGGDNKWTPLHYASSYGNFELVKILLEAGVDVNAKDKEGKTALHVAAECGKYRILKELLDDEKADVMVADKEGNTVLHYIAKESLPLGNEGKWVISSIVQHEAIEKILNTKNYNGQTPLHLLIQNDPTNWNFATFIKYLVDQNIDIFDKDNTETTPFQLAIRLGGIKRIEGIFPDWKNHVGNFDFGGKTLLHWAAIEGNLQFLDEVLNELKKVKKSKFICPLFKIQSQEGKTIFHYAVIYNRAKILDYLLSFQGQNAKNLKNRLNIQDKDGNTALYYSVENGYLYIVKLLLSKGANKEIQNNQGEIPLDIARRKGWHVLAQILSMPEIPQEIPRYAQIVQWTQSLDAKYGTNNPNKNIPIPGNNIHLIMAEKMEQAAKITIADADNSHETKTRNNLMVSIGFVISEQPHYRYHLHEAGIPDEDIDNPDSADLLKERGKAKVRRKFIHGYLMSGAEQKAQADEKQSQDEQLKPKLFLSGNLPPQDCLMVDYLSATQLYSRELEKIGVYNIVGSYGYDKDYDDDRYWHSEPKFLGFLKEENHYTLTEPSCFMSLLADEPKGVKIYAVVIDILSFYDVCDRCEKGVFSRLFQEETFLWKLEEELYKNGFILPKGGKLKVLIRVSAFTKYRSSYPGKDKLYQGQITLREPQKQQQDLDEKMAALNVEEMKYVNQFFEARIDDIQNKNSSSSSSSSLIGPASLSNFLAQQSISTIDTVSLLPTLMKELQAVAAKVQEFFQILAPKNWHLQPKDTASALSRPLGDKAHLWTQKLFDEIDMNLTKKMLVILALKSLISLADSFEILIKNIISHEILELESGSHGLALTFAPEDFKKFTIVLPYLEFFVDAINQIFAGVEVDLQEFLNKFRNIDSILNSMDVDILANRNIKTAA